MPDVPTYLPPPTYSIALRQVDPSHPRLLERWLREEGAWEGAFVTQAEAEAMRMVGSFEDFGGLQRFCRLEWEGAAAEGGAGREAP